MTVTFSRAGACRGAVEMLPLVPTALVFGMVFGLMAARNDLSGAEAALMSATVFAGASQFAAMQIWADPVPATVIVLSTLAINARHLLMGVVLSPWLRPLGKPRALISLFFLVDETWGYSVTDMRKGGTDAAYLLGGGLSLYVMWIAGTIIGQVGGGVVTDPAMLALDFLPVALFLALLMTFWDGLPSLLPWAVAAAIAFAADRWLGPGWPVLLGALGGAFAGAVFDGWRGQTARTVP